MDMEKRERRSARADKRGKAGETLMETLITMLIVGLSSVLFLTMTATAGRIFRKAETEYNRIYNEITRADVQEEPHANSGSIGKMTVKGSGAASVTVDVDWYGSTDYVLSYKVK